MSKKSGPKPPPAPDPVATARAQSDANLATAQAQQKLNMVGTRGPQGAVSYVADPSQPGGYTQVTSLSPQEQQSYDLTKAAENAALQTATGQIGRVDQALSRGFSYDGLPALRGQVGANDFSADRQRVEDAMYGRATARLDRQYGRLDDQLETRLANQGLSMNSDAYRTARGDFVRDRDDAYAAARNDAIMAGGSEQARLYGLERDAATFQNQARQQGANEKAFEQNLPLEQFQALLGTGSVGAPQGVAYTPSQVAGTDVLGAYALSQQAQQNAFQAKQANRQAMMGGLFQLGSAAATAMAASDRRLKRDVVRLGTRPDGLGVYAWRYVWGGPAQMGVMADEVAEVYPHAVGQIGGGFLGVDYGALP